MVEERSKCSQAAQTRFWVLNQDLQLSSLSGAPDPSVRLLTRHFIQMFHRTLTFYLSQCHLFIFIHPVFLMSLLLHFSVNVSFSYVSTSTSTGPLSTETWVSSFPLLSLLIQVVTSPFLPLKYIDTLSH